MRQQAECDCADISQALNHLHTMAEDLELPVPFSALTARQHQVLALVAQHRTSKEIAGQLGVSASAVNQRIELLRARLGGVSRAELARLYKQFYVAADGSADCNSLPWERIQLPSSGSPGEKRATESIPLNASVAPLVLPEASGGIGSRLSVNSPPFLRPADPNPVLTVLTYAGFALVAVVVAALVTVATGAASLPF